MRHLKVLAAAALIGGTVVACTDDTYYGNRAYYGSGYTTQYVYSPAPAYTAYPSSPYSWRADRDRDGVPNWRDRAPDNSFYR